MSKKILATAIVLVALGGISIPGGFIINNYIKDLTYSSVDEGLLGIKEQGIDIVKESTMDLGEKALAINFDLTLELGMDYSIPLVNSTIFMNQIYTVESTTSYPLLPTQTLFFDEVNATVPLLSDIYNFSRAASTLGYPPIKGISQWFGMDLNFTNGIEDGNFTGLNNLKYGRNTTGMDMWWGDRLPGIYEDTYDRVGDGDWPPENFADSVATVDVNQDRGFGVLRIMELIESANETQIKEMCGPNGYNFSNPYDNFTYKGENYTKLEIFYFYYNDYFVYDVFDMILVQFNTPGSALYNAYPQYQARDWNGDNTDYCDLARYSFIEQWAKCSSFDKGADLHDSEPSIPAGTYGLEPGGPGNSSGIPMQAALQLWNKSDEYSLLNLEGITRWYEANSTPAIYNEILTHFENLSGYADYENVTYGESDWGFNNSDMDTINKWLWRDDGPWNQSFYIDLFPNLLTDEIAFRILLEQWAYGAVRGYVLYPDGTPLPLGFITIYGLEIGYQGPDQPIISTNMSIESAYALWDTKSEFSLVTKSGLNKWFAAVAGDSEAKTELMIENGLSEGDMVLILEWIPNFQQNVMPFLAQYQMGLPTDSITLGNIIQGAAIGIGAGCLGLGSAGIASNIIIRRKRLNPLGAGT